MVSPTARDKRALARIDRDAEGAVESDARHIQRDGAANGARHRGRNGRISPDCHLCGEREQSRRGQFFTVTKSVVPSPRLSVTFSA